MAEFVPVFAHPRLTSSAYSAAVSRYFDSGIQVPIVIFADPTGREIPGTRLDHGPAQVKSTYLDHARKALEAFRGGKPAEEARKEWAAFGLGLRLRAEGGDPGAGVEVLAALRDAARKDSILRRSVDELLARLEKEEAAGLLELAQSDLGGDDPATGIEGLCQVIREFPGLPSAAKAREALEKAKADPARREAAEKGERELAAWLALRAADRLAREGKTGPAAEARAKVIRDFPGTDAARRAAEQAEEKGGGKRE